VTKLQLSVAMGDYDRTRALFDGRVQIDGVDPVYMLLNPEEMFFRSMRSMDFDITELSLSSYLVKHSRGECPYIAVPVFLSRAFRHTSIYVRKDRIKKPEDLKGQARRPARIPAHRQRLGSRDPAGRLSACALPT
jgi:4,5-dihydroxyphthalate decarboxylase